MTLVVDDADAGPAPPAAGSTTAVWVAVQVWKITGERYAGARVRFDLTAADIENGIVAPYSKTVTMDGSGYGSVQLWSNAAGSQGTQYKVTVEDSRGRLLYSGLATIPATSCYLHEVLDLDAPELVAVSVRWDGAQTLTSAQKVQAQTNIGLDSSHIGTVMTEWFNSLPTSLPATSGVLWNNAGVLTMS